MPNAARLLVWIALLIGTAFVALQPSRASTAESLAGPLEARVVEVLDGDSLRVIVHVWLGQHIETLVRIRGIDAPERRGRCAGEIAAAAEATATLGRLVGSGPVILHRVAGDKYFGRVLADVTSDAGVELAPAMLAGGFARAYDGAGARRGWCDKAAQPPETVLGTVR